VWFAIGLMALAALFVGNMPHTSDQQVLLSGMSAGAIAPVGWMFRDWRKSASYWLTLLAFLLLHAAAIYMSSPSWVPEPTILLAPLFILDFVVMATVFPVRAERSNEDEVQPPAR
jgi:hypothetical protein